METKTIKVTKRGNTFRRISDGQIFSPEITLGYTYYLGGKKLDEPLLELPEHFEEVEMPPEMLEMYKEVWDSEEE